MPKTFRTLAVALTCVFAVTGCSLLKKKDKAGDAGVAVVADPGAALAATPPPTATAVASAQPVPAKAAIAIGSRGQVLWKGRYYAATVIGLAGADKYKIHYNGYESSWDEVVGPSRMSGFGAAPAAGAGGGAGGGSGGGARAGGGAAAADAPCPGPGLTRRCSGRCVNIQTDDRNCGGCGTVCSGGKHCDGHMFCRDAAGNL